MAKIKETDYLFATARVRGVEKNLLTKSKIEKMLDAKTLAEAGKILKDSDYGEGAVEIADTDYEALLSSEQRKTAAFIQSIAPQPEIFNIFLFTYDYHNIKVLLKAEFLGIEAPADHMLDAGTIPVSRLKVLVRERTYTGLTQNMAHAVAEVLDMFGRTSDPQVIDLILDQATFLDIKEAAAASGNLFVNGYVKTYLDTVNLKSFARVRQMKKSWDFFAKIFIEGGNIPQKLFVSSYEEPLEQFADRLNSLGFGEVMRQGAEKFKATGKFTELEKQCDNKLLDYVHQAKYVSFGVEPLIGYMVAKETEIKVARIIMSGKAAGLKADIIRERLREAYA